MTKTIKDLTLFIVNYGQITFNKKVAWQVLNCSHGTSLLQQTFNFYVKNSINFQPKGNRNNFKPPEKKESENIFAKLYQLELEKEKQNSQWKRRF